MKKKSLINELKFHAAFISETETIRNALNYYKTNSIVMELSKDGKLLKISFEAER